MENQLPQNAIDQMLNTNRAFKRVTELTKRLETLGNDYQKTKDELFTAEASLKSEQNLLHEVLKTI